MNYRYLTWWTPHGSRPTDLHIKLEYNPGFFSLKNGTSLIICIKFLAYSHWPANYQLLYTINVLSSLSFKDFCLILTSSFLCLASYTTMLAWTSPHESYLLSIILVIPYNSPTSYLLNQGNSLQHLSKLLAFGSASHGTCFIQLQVPSCPPIPLPYYSCMLLECHGHGNELHLYLTRTRHPQRSTPTFVCHLFIRVTKWKRY